MKCVYVALFNFSIKTPQGNVQKQLPGGVLWKKKGSCNFIKKRLWHRCFPLNFANSKEHFRAAASQCFTHIESSKLMYKTNQWTGFYAGETLFEHD